MYFKGVNRGMAFTKPGFYLTLLICVAGVLATGSGSNALFLTLGVGLGALIVSGILSEKVMHACEVKGIEPAQAVQGAPFSLPVRLQNTHRSWTCYGLEIWIHEKAPKYKLLPSSFRGTFHGNVLRISPGERVLVATRTSGLPRGHWKKLFLTQTTLFPFNLVRKFKVDEVSADVAVLPKLDLDLFRLLEQAAAESFHNSHLPQEFHSHRLLQGLESHRRVDWKKSLSADPSLWVVKVFEDVQEQFGICIRPEWGYLSATTTENSYEAFLSRIYTACEFSRLSGREWYLDTGSAFLTANQVRDFLAGFPQFKEAGLAAWLQSVQSEEPAKNLVHLELSADTHVWKISEMQRRAK